MSHLKRVPLAFALACFAALAVAAPVPKATKAPISAENADRVRSVTEVDKRAHRIIRGPQRGELILLDWSAGVEVVDEATLRTLRVLAKDHRPTDFAVSPDGKYATWTERGKTAYTLEPTGGKAVRIEIDGDPGSAAFSPDSKLLAIGKTVWDPNAEGVGESEVRLYDLAGKLVRTLEKSGPGGLTPAFSPDGKTLAVGNRNHETRLFDVASGKLLHTLDKKMTQGIAFSPDGKTLAAGYVNGDVALWDVATGKLLHAARSGGKETYSVDWSPKGDVLASSGRDGKIVLWEPQQMKALKELDAPSWVIQVRFTADGTRLLSSSASDHGAKSDRKITAWAAPDAAK